MQQIELYYELANLVENICVTLFNAYCLVIWARPFMAERRKAKYAGIVYAAGMFVAGWPLFYISAMLVYGAVTCAAFFVLWRLDREYGAQKLFLAVTFFCLRWQAWRIAACISNGTYGLLESLKLVKDKKFWFQVYVADRSVMVILGAALMYAAVRCLLWAYGERREHMTIREFLLLVMPSVSGVFAYGIFRYYNFIYERDSGKSPFSLYGTYDLIILCYSVVCFVTIFVMIYVFRQWKHEQEEDKQKEVLARQIQDMQSHIDEVERLYGDMRRLRHDVGNHLMTLEQLYGGGNYEEAVKYARTLKQEMQEVTLDVSSGNPVTDVILSGRKKEMEEKGIQFECDFHYPQTGEMNVFDVSVILNNALSNAIEAVEQEKVTVVSLSSGLMKNIFMIEVSNSYSKELHNDGADGLPRTTKSGEGHGFGLANIRYVARKYYGDMEIGKETYQGRECCVLRVMLQLGESQSS